MTIAGEAPTEGKLPDEIYSYPDKVRSLDPDSGRPVEEIAFENIHHMDTPYNGDPYAAPTLFISELLQERTGVGIRSRQCEAAYKLARSFHSYGHRLRKEILETQPDNEERSLILAEIDRREEMWHQAISNYISPVKGAAKKLHDNRVKMRRGAGRSAS